MLKVLLVDDESWVVESLKDLVEWERYGFRVVGQAASGEEALATIGRLRPEVVFTDIRMPEMNGLELIRRGRNLPEPIQFVVVSGYAEFAYAQKALAYGAVAYCLKPFDELEIAGVLVKLAAKLGEARGAVPAETLLRLLDEPDPEVADRLLGELRERGLMERIAAGVVPVVAIGGGEPPGLAGAVFRLKTGATKTAYLAGVQEVKAARADWEAGMPDGVTGIGIGRPVSDWRAIREAIADADIAAHQRFVAGRSGVYETGPGQEEALNACMLDVGKAVEDKNGQALFAAFDRIGSLFREGGLSIRHAFQVYNMTNSYLFKLGRTETALYSYEQLVQAFADVHAMLAGLAAVSTRYLRQSDAPVPETRNQTFNAILQYVTLNYREDLSLQGLSEQFFMNPSYISQLFKKEVDETFTAYVARLRIGNACELLRETGDSVQEIAAKIGYQDYFYFTRLFKKLTGQTPSQYRESTVQPF
ncbi:response regulator transcription factor [Cohnella sp. JJ-181]|uniref:response regulator transcription factor n=1 Tax=Cohnella rhizoplanae TaxID=2974897 RepID=UPI0022FF91B9|nr:helix-turn-helix domain-containing protein [Cohnella sp. JJ-181]CAI6040373.1 Protein-glutamate methylesterase/protein-glutamine glutaminase [Cohnella sp. JJ-181]